MFKSSEVQQTYVIYDSKPSEGCSSTNNASQGNSDQVHHISNQFYQNSDQKLRDKNFRENTSNELQRITLTQNEQSVGNSEKL